MKLEDALSRARNYPGYSIRRSPCPNGFSVAKKRSRTGLIYSDDIFADDWEIVAAKPVHKTCPFCGGEPLLLWLSEIPGNYQVIVRCFDCHAQTPVCGQEHRAWKMWDRRNGQA